MDQVKIGKFIAERRKLLGLTQIQLGEKLAVTDRAVSKWETGRTMPDSSIMLELCSLLKISVTDLLTGEIVTMENKSSQLEKELLEMLMNYEFSTEKPTYACVIEDVNMTNVPEELKNYIENGFKEEENV